MRRTPAGTIGCSDLLYEALQLFRQLLDSIAERINFLPLGNDHIIKLIEP